jgi:hypothetical protein
MNAVETTRLLRHRAQLTRIGYVSETVTAWTQALSDLSYEDAHRALLTLTDAGETNITVPAIRNHLRKTAPAPPPTPSPPRDPGCTCQSPSHEFPMGHLCEMHIRIGLDAINRIRAQRSNP